MTKLKILLITMVLCCISIGVTAAAAMTAEQAAQYQKEHKEIYLNYRKVTDINREKQNDMYLSLIGRSGIYNVGESQFDFRIYYTHNDPNKPKTYIIWSSNVTSDVNDPFQFLWEADYLNILFADGYEQRFPLNRYFLIVDSFKGYIDIDDATIIEMSKHGIVKDCYLSHNGNIRFFFYSGDKQLDKKEKFTKGIQHAMVILGLQ